MFAIHKKQLLNDSKHFTFYLRVYLKKLALRVEIMMKESFFFAFIDSIYFSL